MFRFLIRRLFAAGAVLAVMSFVVYGLIGLMPGDPIDLLASGGEGMRVLGIGGAVPVEGGVPIVDGGTIVGAIGVSGGTSAQDGQCARAGIGAAG